MTEIIKSNNAMAFDLLEPSNPEQVNSGSGEFFSSLLSNKEMDVPYNLDTDKLKTFNSKSLEKNMSEIINLVMESELDISDEILSKIEMSIKSFFQAFIAENINNLESGVGNKDGDFLKLMKFLDQLKDLLPVEQNSTESSSEEIDLILDKIRTNLNRQIKNFYKSHSKLIETKNNVLISNKSKQDHLAPANSSHITDSARLINAERKNPLTSDIEVRLATKDISSKADSNEKKFKTVGIPLPSRLAKSEFKSNASNDMKVFDGKIDYTSLQALPNNSSARDSITENTLLKQSTNPMVQSDVDQNSNEGSKQRSLTLPKESGNRLLENLNMLSKNWGDKLIEKIEKSIVDGIEKLEILLTPKSLGRLNVIINLQENMAKINIVAETASAAALLGEAESKLAQMMEGSGLKLASLQTLTQQFNNNNKDKGNPSKHNPTKKKNNLEQSNTIEVRTQKDGKEEGLNLIA